MSVSSHVRLGTASAVLRELPEHVFQRVCAAALLVLLSPILVAVWGVLRAQGTPALFFHERVGLSGRRFEVVKFRTMRSEAEMSFDEVLACDRERQRQWHIYGKLAADPRITRFGRFLRRTSLDELPQLWNVIRGDMNLIGPRPVTEAELRDHYGLHRLLYQSRRPGMTGLWQVSGRNRLTYRQRVRLDVFYLRQRSKWLDLRILGKTVRSVLACDGM